MVEMTVPIQHLMEPPQLVVALVAHHSVAF
jgi:hypothetical protein